MSRYLISIVLYLLLASTPSRATDLHFNVELLPSDAYMPRLDINNSGTIVGTVAYYASPIEGAPLSYMAFRYGNEVFETFPSLYSGNGINDSGYIVGDGLMRAPTGNLTILTGLSDANAINNRHQVAGHTGFEAALWNGPGDVQMLGSLGRDYSIALDLNEHGQVVGYGENAQGISRPFLYSDGVMHDIGGPGDGSGFAQSINEAGAVAGAIATGMGYRGFLFENGVTSLIPLVANSYENVALDINNLGWVVGYSSMTSAVPYLLQQQGFLYINGEMLELSKLLVPGWTVRRGVGTNDAGQILADVCDAVTCYYALLSPVPEPAAWLLLGIGLPVLAGSKLRDARRRRSLKP